MGKLGADLSAEALAGVGLAGGRVFEFDNQDDANAFQETVQAAGGFDGILRDLASYDDEIPLLGWDNPLGGVNDWALDQLGIDENAAAQADGDLRRGQRRPQRLRTAGAGVGGADGEPRPGSRAPARARSDQPRQERRLRGDHLRARRGRQRRPEAGTPRRLDGELGFDGDDLVDAENADEPDKLVLKGNVLATWSARHRPCCSRATSRRTSGRPSSRFSPSSSERRRPGPWRSGRARPDRPAATSAATLAARTSQGQNVAPGARDQRGRQAGFYTYDLADLETEGSIKVGLGRGRRRWRQLEQRDPERLQWLCACRAACFSRAPQELHDDGRETTPIPLVLRLLAAAMLASAATGMTSPQT